MEDLIILLYSGVYIEDHAPCDYYDSIASGTIWYDFWDRDLVAIKGEKLFTFYSESCCNRICKPADMRR